MKTILTTNFCYNLVILGITRKFQLAKVGRLFKGADRRETGSGREVLQRCLGYQPGLDLGRNEADLISPIKEPKSEKEVRGAWPANKQLWRIRYIWDLPWFAMSPVSIVILYQYSIHHIVIIYSISINNTTEINSITPSSYVSFFRRIELRVNSSAKVQITIHSQPTSQTLSRKTCQAQPKATAEKKMNKGGNPVRHGHPMSFFLVVCYFTICFSLKWPPTA